MNKGHPKTKIKRFQLIPSKDQYLGWSIPSKVTYLGFWIGIIALIITIVSFCIDHSANQKPLSESDTELTKDSIVQLNFKERAFTYLQARYPKAVILQKDLSISAPKLKNSRKDMTAHIAMDSDTGVKQRFLVIENLGSSNYSAIAKGIVAEFEKMNSNILIEKSNTQQVGGEINTNQMVFSPVLIIYTSMLLSPRSKIVKAFKDEDIIIQLINESRIPPNNIDF